jgi:hypothetical protein
MKKSTTTLTVVCLLASQGVLKAGEKPQAPAPAPSSELQMDLSMLGIWSNVNGDSARFREQQQYATPFSGGIEKFWWAGDIYDGLTFEMDGRALYEQDYGFNMNLIKEDVGSIRVKADTYRHYYDSTVANSSFTPLIADELSKELYTTRSLYSIEGILALPNLPKFTLGYERTGRDGNQNLPWGGWVRQSPPGNDWIMWNNPLSRELDYTSDRVYLGVDHTIGGFDIRFQQEWEQFDGTQYHMEPGYYTNGVLVFNRFYNNDLDHTMWTTRLQATKELIEDKLILNMNYVYRNTDNDNNADVDATKPDGTIHDAEHSINYVDNTHDGSLGRHVGTANLTWHPSEDMTFFGGLGFTYGDADNNAIRNESGSGASTTSPAVYNRIDETWTFNTDTIEQTVSESFRATFSQIPRTRVTFTADLEQSNVDYDWNAMIWTAGFAGESKTGEGDWLWDADTDYKKSNFGINLRSDPWKFLSANLSYKYKSVSADVNESEDTATPKPGDPEYEPGVDVGRYYPGTIEGWDRATHITSLTFDIKPVRRITVRPVLEWETSEYDSEDQIDGSHEISNFDRFGYGVAMDLQIASRTTLTFNYMNQDITTETEAGKGNGATNSTPGYIAAVIDEFDGSYETLGSVLTYSGDRFTTSLNGGMTKGEGSWDTHYYWVGLNGSYNISEKLTARAGYTYYKYDESNNGGVNNYTANGAFVGLRYEF